MGMAQRIKECRIEKGLTQEELASRLGLQKSAIAKYENGRVENVKRSTIENMAKVLDCEPSYLMGWVDIPNYKNISKISTRRFPVLGSVSCGEPKLMTEESDLYIDVTTNVKADFVLKAKGDSMIGARIQDGDIVFVRSQPTVENGEIAVVAINDEATLKRFYYYKDKAMLILKAANPDYEDQIYVGEELSEVHVLGKAVAFQSDVR